MINVPTWTVLLFEDWVYRSYLDFEQLSARFTGEGEQTTLDAYMTVA